MTREWEERAWTEAKTKIQNLVKKGPWDTRGHMVFQDQWARWGKRSGARETLFTQILASMWILRGRTRQLKLMRTWLSLFISMSGGGLWAYGKVVVGCCVAGGNVPVKSDYCSHINTEGNIQWSPTSCAFKFYPCNVSCYFFFLDFFKVLSSQQN